MDERKTLIRFFTIADYEEEEVWLRQQHREGWRLFRLCPPCFYTFEKCAPEDVVYRLDFKNNRETGDYFQLFRDYGWENIGRCFGWLYFRRSASVAEPEQDSEIFSDEGSRLEMIDRVIKTRLLPLFLIFVGIVIPNLFQSVRHSGPLEIVFTLFFAAIALLYLYLLVHCGRKLQKLRKKYGNG